MLSRDTDQKARYMAIIRNSPWAKLMTLTMPKMSVRPMLIRE